MNTLPSGKIMHERCFRYHIIASTAASTRRLRNIHDRIGGNKPRRRGHAETSNQIGAEWERAGRTKSDQQASSQRAASGTASAHGVSGSARTAQCADSAGVGG